MADWWDLAAQGANYYLKDKQTGDIESDVVGGYNQARQDIKQTTQPYQDQAQWGMQGYKKEGPFDFTYEGYLSSPEFQWMQDQTRQARERGAAAGQQGLYSGQTLADLNRDLYNVTAQGYGDEFNRQLAAQQARENYWYRPVTTGSTVANASAKALSDLAVDRGEARGAFEAAEAQNLNEFLAGALGGQADVGQVGGLIKDAWDMIGGEDGFGGSITDFAKEFMDGGFLTDAIKDTGTYLGNLANGSITGLLGSGTGLSAWGPGSQAAMLAEQTAAFGLEGTQLTTEALNSVIGGTEAAAQGAGLATDAMNFLASPGGMGLTAAAVVLLTGGDVKDAAITGGASYLGAAIGTAIMPGIGTMIGGALGGFVASMGLGGDQAKTDSVMGFIAPDQDYMQQVEGGRKVFKDGVYSEGPWGAVGMWGSGTRHIDVGDDYQQAFDTVTKIDSMLYEALTPEENQAMLDLMSGDLKSGVSGYTFRDKSNEGKINAKKVLRDTLAERNSLLQQALSPERYAQMEIDQLYTSIIDQI